MHGTPLPAQLAGPPLNDRELVIDACYRAFASIDHADMSLLDSATTEDVYTNIADKICDGRDELKSKVLNHIANNLDTVHYLSNMRVSVDTPTTARVTFTATSVHCVLEKGFEPGPNKYTAGAIYACDAVKTDDEWRLKKMQSHHVWGEGNRAIMKPENAE
ncbi:hypothetical protein BU24DRAFT_419081 [Aaosphaeria arxii CBS 175.79]|uniref:SnoaL-like domain-containing protein n=1 Tax=Aaosphaeria arxii CBS 175.79 TaxID=1450172 RepID=A0A6A5Y2J4_9PLEO|nr:uncharacterized protein BU24DRAFT_419081 [Aaosphaeria arxii CBS 175.79]KAF2019469.1 hypothetical protein BU24DRAFT_419081 [Aaosphaeria arxii CBS 175.79]